MNQEMIKDYLKNCEDRIIKPAMESGLDEKTHYLYLSVIYQALNCDVGARRIYQRKMGESMEKILSSADSFFEEEKQVSPLEGSGIRIVKRKDAVSFSQFGLQRKLVSDLISFVLRDVFDECLKPFGRAQLRFAKMLMEQQKTYINLVINNMPINAVILKHPEWMNGCARSSDACSEMYARVNRALVELEKK